MKFRGINLAFHPDLHALLHFGILSRPAPLRIESKYNPPGQWIQRSYSLQDHVLDTYF